MIDAVILPPPNSTKGRSFRAKLLASVDANRLWRPGDAATYNLKRPVFAVFGSTDAELRAFMANARDGKRVLTRDSADEKTVEFLKSEPYEVAWQRDAVGTTCTIFRPQLFSIDPGTFDPDEVKFICMPPAAWCRTQQIADAGRAVDHASKLGIVKTDDPVGYFGAWVPLAYLFAAYLDRRTRCPILADGRFYMQLLLAFLETGRATLSRFSGDSVFYRGNHGFETHGVEELGYAPGIAFRSDNPEVESVLAAETTKFFRLTKGS